MKINVFVQNKVSRRVLDRSWPILVARGGPRGGLLETKLGSRRVRKSEAKKGLVLGGLCGPFLVVLGVLEGVLGGLEAVLGGLGSS